MLAIGASELGYIEVSSEALGTLSYADHDSNAQLKTAQQSAVVMKSLISHHHNDKLSLRVMCLQLEYVERATGGQQNFFPISNVPFPKTRSTCRIKLKIVSAPKCKPSWRNVACD